MIKTLQLLEDRKLDSSSPAYKSSPAGRNPQTAAALSLLPGIGQLYNGETGKGALFLSVAIANFALMLSLLFCEPVLKGLSTAASWCNLQVGLDVNHCLRIIHGESTAVVLYALLYLSFVAYAVKDAYTQARNSQRGAVYAKFFLGMPEATSGSYLFHFVLVSASLLLVLLIAAPPKPTEQAVEIDLVAPPPPEKPAPAPRRPQAEVQPPKPVPQPLPQPKPVATPVAVAIPTNQPSALSTAPLMAPPADPSPATNGSSSGQGAADSNGTSTDVDYGTYLSEVQRKIKKAWYPPPGNESKRITVKFRIRKGGDIGSIRLVESSGVAMADTAASAAVTAAAPFPPLPAGSPDEVVVKFTFDYTVFTGEGKNAARKL